MIRSSRADAAWRELEYIHSCGWEGALEFDVDPEIDRSSMYAECPGCGAEITEPI